MLLSLKKKSAHSLLWRDKERPERNKRRGSLNFWFFCFKTKEQRNFILNTFLEKVLQKSVRSAFSNHKQNNAKALFDSEPIACEASKKDGLIKNALRKTGFGALKTKYHPVVEQKKCIRCTLHQERAKNIQPYFV